MDQRINRLAKVCWNTNSWTSPSGLYGKSLSPDTFERQNGFGHEEWLLDLDKLVDGYHYGHLQAIENRSRRDNIDAYNVTLFSTNSVSGTSFWIGKINNLRVIDELEATTVLEFYHQEGWLDRMNQDINDISGTPLNFQQSAIHIFNLKFRPQDLLLFEGYPIPFSNGERVPGHRYLLFEQTPEFVPHMEREDLRPAEFMPNVPDAEDGTGTTFTRTFNAGSREYYNMHREIKNKFHAYLNTRYPGKTQKEAPTNVGDCRIDLKFKTDEGKYIFYEIKTYPTLLQSIRVGIGQLMEYAYFPNQNDAVELVIVSFLPLSPDIITYLNRVSADFKIPIGYIQFDQFSNSIVDNVNCTRF